MAEKMQKGDQHVRVKASSEIWQSKHSECTQYRTRRAGVGRVISQILSKAGEQVD